MKRCTFLFSSSEVRRRVQFWRHLLTSSLTKLVVFWGTFTFTFVLSTSLNKTPLFFYFTMTLTVTWLYCAVREGSKGFNKMDNEIWRKWSREVWIRILQRGAHVHHMQICLLHLDFDCSCKVRLIVGKPSSAHALIGT